MPIIATIALRCIGLPLTVEFDAVADPAEALHEYGAELLECDELPQSVAIVAPVTHHDPLEPLPADYRKIIPNGGYSIEVKSRFSQRAAGDVGASMLRH